MRRSRLDAAQVDDLVPLAEIRPLVREIPGEDNTATILPAPVDPFTPFMGRNPGFDELRRPW